AKSAKLRSTSASVISRIIFALFRPRPRLYRCSTLCPYTPLFRSTQLVNELAHLARGSLEGLLGVVHRIDLVHGDDDLRDVQQGGDGEVAAGLLDHAVTDVDEDDHQVGGGHAGDGVAGVQHVPRGVREDKAAAVGGEVAVGHVDGNTLLTLCAQAVDQQREVRVL